MAGSQTTIDSLRSVRHIIDRMNQHLLDNVKKSVGQEGIRVKFVGTEDNLAVPLTKRITDHEGLGWLCRIDHLDLDSIYYQLFVRHTSDFKTSFMLF